MSQYNYDYDDYDDQPRRYRNVQTRPRGRDEPDYVREETYIERGKGAGPRDLVHRGREDSIEDIPRDFPPPGGRDRQYARSSYKSEVDDTRSRRSKSAAGRSRYDDDDYYEDDRSTTYSRRTRDKGRRRRDRDYDSEYSSSRSPSPKKERRKSGFEDVLGGLGLGGIAAALTGKKDRDRSDSRDRSVRSGRSRSRAGSRRRRSSSEGSDRTRGGGKKDTEKKWAQAAQAALIAGAVEAFRSRKEPGPWNGDKGKRIATAAIGAGGIDGLLDRNPNEKTKRHLAEAVIGGLAANRFANGPRSQSQTRGRGVSGSPDSRPASLRSRSRSVIDRFRGRSQSRGRSVEGEGGGGGGAGALKGLAAGGALAAAGKAIYDRVRSKSRKRESSRGSSADSYVPSRNRRRDRRGSQRPDTRSQGGTDQRRDPASRGIDQSEANGPGNGALVGAGAAGAGAGALATRGGGGGQDGGNEKGNAGGENTDSSTTSDMEIKRKRMRGKELLTAGLATIATIHAAHGVYSSMEAHETRHKQVAEGEITPEEARKKQTKAWVQDAAAVGIAALGIKGAFSEWKEMNEHRYINFLRHPNPICLTSVR